MFSLLESIPKISEFAACIFVISDTARDGGSFELVGYYLYLCLFRLISGYHKSYRSNKTIDRLNLNMSSSSRSDCHSRLDSFLQRPDLFWPFGYCQVKTSFSYDTQYSNPILKKNLKRSFRVSWLSYSMIHLRNPPQSLGSDVSSILPQAFVPAAHLYLLRSSIS